MLLTIVAIFPQSAMQYDKNIKSLFLLYATLGINLMYRVAF